MDATAQAELVSSGEATPAELMDAAVARAEKVNPEINAIIHDLSASAREQAGESYPTGPSGASRSCSRTSGPQTRASRCTWG